MRSRPICLLMVSIVVLCASTVAAQRSGWREPWEVTLASRPSGGVPDALILRLENHGAVVLVGENIVFNLYRDGLMYGSAIDPPLRAERFEIPVGGAIERTSWRRDWRYQDLIGGEIPRSEADRDLAGGRWEIVATLTDLATPKPQYESSYLIWSTIFKFSDLRDE